MGLGFVYRIPIIFPSRVMLFAVAFRIMPFPAVRNLAGSKRVPDDQQILMAVKPHIMHGTVPSGFDRFAATFDDTDFVCHLLSNSLGSGSLMGKSVPFTSSQVQHGFKRAAIVDSDRFVTA